mgnify:CR=1 FL=1
MDSNLLLVGCGKMGTALLRGWLSSGFKSNDILIIEPDEKTVGFPKSQGVRVINSVEMLDQSYEARVVVFAVKPHAMGAVLPAYQATDLSNSVVLSIAAGITLDFLEGYLVGHQSLLIDLDRRCSLLLHLFLHVFSLFHLC